MPKIYIPNKGCHDFSGAEKFGTLVVMTQGAFNLTSIGRMFRIFYDHLKNSSPDDYILICGPAVMNSVASSIFSSRHGRLNLLLYKVYSDGIGRYKARHIKLN